MDLLVELVVGVQIRLQTDVVVIRESLIEVIVHHAQVEESQFRSLRHSVALLRFTRYQNTRARPIKKNRPVESLLLRSKRCDNSRYLPRSHTAFGKLKRANYIIRR